MQYKRHSRGFSMIELVAVLAILAVLAWLAIPLAEVTRQRQREQELRRALWEIRDAIDAYKRVYDANSPTGDPLISGYPPTLQALVQGLVNVKASGRQVYFLRRVPRDPFSSAQLPAEQTWTLRSSGGSTDDVYDVHSKAPGAGLNGQPFRDW